MPLPESRNTLLVATAFLALALGIHIRAQPAATAPQANTFTNPIAIGADPFIVRHDGAYYWSQSENDLGVAICKSDTPASLGERHIVWRAPATGPCSQQVWAPELHFLDGRWYIYVAASDGDNATHRMIVLESANADPLSAYTFKAELYTGDNIADKTPSRWAIDGTVLTHRGKRYFIWSGWEDDRDKQSLYAAPMSNPWTVSGNRVRLCDNDDYLWERVDEKRRGRGLNEGPQILEHNNRVFIIYSASGSWQTSYKLGLLELTGDNPLAPGAWRKHPKPVFSPTDKTWGVGHGSFTKSPDGAEDWIVYHAKLDRAKGWNRGIFAQPFTWTADGFPDFGTPVAPGKPIAFPSTANATTPAPADTAAPLAELARNFATPPDSARPWVYWMWVGSNVTRESITADLESMQRVGIGGVLLMDVDQGAPSAMKLMSPEWQDMFVHAVREAKRLGLEFNFNNCSGWNGSGGPWVPPEESMQRVYASETRVKPGAHFSGTLPKPKDTPEYRDIAVLAIAENPSAKPPPIPDFALKSLTFRAGAPYRSPDPTPLDATAPADTCIPLSLQIDLTDRLSPDADGKLDWRAPALPDGREWTILRLGHATNGERSKPTPPDQTGPEVDKLNKTALRHHFDYYVKHLFNSVPPEARSALVSTHIDSWEAGGQNWTPGFREEFQKRRGYDIVPWLPTLTGRIINDLHSTERFLHDLRQTVSEMTQENYSAEFQRLAHAQGLHLSCESYTTIAHDLDNARYADEPMSEFWTPNGWGIAYQSTTKAMSSVAHITGKKIVGAEAFTSAEHEKFLWHPAMFKKLGDEAFCGGVNRIVFHRFAGQKFGAQIPPGIQMGPWGLHYERTNTWWEFTTPWHQYLARCQYLLRQGDFVADVLRLAPEEPLHRVQDIAIDGHAYDSVGPDTFLDTATVRDGRIVFPSGATYRLLVLPDTPLMSVQLLSRIRQMVAEGAAILGAPPQRTPGLANHAQADATLQKIAAQIWRPENTRVFRDITPARALAALDICPDFTSTAGIKYLHRRTADADIYFLAHTGDERVLANCTFRITGKQPWCWNPETGAITPLRAWRSEGREQTTLSIPFQPSGSLFIVFPHNEPLQPRITDVKLSGVPLVENGLHLLRPSLFTPEINLITGDLRDHPTWGNTYTITTSDGRARDIPAPSYREITITGPWRLRFPAGWGAPAEITLDELIPWNRHPDAGVKYFSGTATYSKTITIPALKNGQRPWLDLGNVQVMARVRLNGRDLGILWKPPFRIDLAPAAKEGENTLEVEVVNLWINRLIGDEQLPEDSERNPNGTLKKWPQWFLDGNPSPAGRFTFSSWRLWKKDDPLQDSGLLGPVKLMLMQQIEL